MLTTLKSGKIHIFRTLAALLPWIALGSSLAWANDLSSDEDHPDLADKPSIHSDVFDSPEQNQVLNDLASRQASTNQAFGNYFDALMSGSSQKTAAAEQELREQNGRIGALLNSQQEKTQKMIFGKYYFRDGTSVDVAEYDRNPEKYAHLNDPGSLTQSNASSSKKNRAPATELPSVSTYSSGQGSAAYPQQDSHSNDTALDGSNIPKEMIFPGKPLQPKKNKTAPLKREAQSRFRSR
jgi:hypothetical protein